MPNLKAATAVELGCLDGVSSNIQTQLDGKLSTAGAVTIGGALGIRGTSLTLAADNVGAETDTTIVFGRGVSAGNDALIEWSAADTAFVFFGAYNGAEIQVSSITGFASIASASIGKNALFLNNDDAKLCYKDSSGNVHQLEN